MLRFRVLRHAGVTLAEMLAVTAVLALAASIAVPTAAPLANLGDNVAAAEVTQSVRFAQREALRTNAWHAVKIDPAAQTLRVYRLTASGTEDTGNPVFHPIDKRRYDVAFGAGSPTRATIALVDFDYDNGYTNQNVLSFAPDGTPALRLGPNDIDIRSMTAGVVGIKTGSGQRNLVIDNVTGRVSG